MSVGITNFRTPQSIVFGTGAFERIGEEAKSRGEKALIISDKVMDSLGFVKRCIDSLAHQGITARIYLGVDTEPTDLYVTEALDLFITEKCDILISLGGGSCIDTAKAVSVIASNGGVIGDYAGAGGKVALLRPIPHIAIPTTAGTGSEATDVTVITNAVTDVKLMVKQETLANLAVESVKNLCLQLKIPNLKDWGINHANFTASIDKMAQDALDSGSPANNPRVPTKQEIKDLYRICYDYDFTVKSFI